MLLYFHFLFLSTLFIRMEVQSIIIVIIYVYYIMFFVTINHIILYRTIRYIMQLVYWDSYKKKFIEM